MRIGLAGGGSDETEYVERHGGAVVSAAIDLVCRANITFQEGSTGLVIGDAGGELAALGLSLRAAAHAEMTEGYKLPTGLYELQTASDMLPGCGLGSSSALVVAIVAAYSEAFDLGLGRKETARAAWTIERRRLRWPGGLQDQYAAAYGGLHLFSFGPSDRVEVAEFTDAKVLGCLESSLALFNPGLFKTGSGEGGRSAHNVDPIGRAELRLDALRLWDAMQAGDLSLLPLLMTRSQQSKRVGVPSTITAALDTLQEIEAVHGVKLCGSGPAGIFLVSHGCGFEQLVAEAERRGVKGIFRRIAFAPPTRNAGGQA